MIKAIIFDFDGVIVESMDIKAKAFADLFRDYPEHIDEIVRFHNLHGGTSRFEKFEIFYKNILHLPLSEEKKKLLGEQFSEFVYQTTIKCSFVAGAKEFLEKYHTKYILFVVSGTPQDELVSIIQQRGLAKYFTGVFGTPGKKEMHNKYILEQYKMVPSETLFVGDSIDDWQGVQGLGIEFVGRITDTNSFEGLKVKTLIHNIFDLEKVLE